MFQNQIPRWAIALVIVLALIGIGSAIYHAGWSQGFAMGLLAGNGESGELPPYLMYGARPGWQHGGFFGGFFRIIFFVFFLAIIAKFFAFWRWRMHGPHGPWRHHHRPPWAEHPHHPTMDEDNPTTRKELQNTDLMYV